MGLSLRAREIITATGDLFLPRTCLVCGRSLLRKERHLCIWCREDLPRTWQWTLPRNAMADRFNALIQRNLSEYEPYSRAAALFFYQGGYRQIPQAVKYRHNRRAGQDFGRELGRLLSGSPLFADVDAVLPVPLHPLRRWRRGYNQAEIIARAVAAEMGVPCLKRILRRRRHTRTQTRLHGAEKAANVQGAFSARPLPARHILLIDDVFTTGATLAACHSALRKVTRARISAATLAFVGSV